MTKALVSDISQYAASRDEFAALFDRPIAFQRCFVPIAGTITGALMLSQAVYWSQRTRNPERWFYKSHREWTEETGMTRKEQETARKRLVSNGVFECALRGVPATTHYRVNFGRLAYLLREAAAASVAQKRTTGCANSDNKMLPNGTTISETTSDTTTEKLARGSVLLTEEQKAELAETEKEIRAYKARNKFKRDAGCDPDMD